MLQGVQHTHNLGEQAFPNGELSWCMGWITAAHHQPHHDSKSSSERLGLYQQTRSARWLWYTLVSSQCTYAMTHLFHLFCCISLSMCVPCPLSGWTNLPIIPFMSTGITDWSTPLFAKYEKAHNSFSINMQHLSTKEMLTQKVGTPSREGSRSHALGQNVH